MSKSIHELIRDTFGTDVSIRDEDAAKTVGVASAQLVKPDSNRVGLVIINLSANEVVISPLRDATLTTGIRLVPSGGSATMNYQDDFDLPSREWFAIAGVAGSAVFVIELVTSLGGVGE